MKIHRIHVSGYGRFVDWESPEFAPELNVILGANEAGKSTLRAFLLDVLFGFHPKVRGRHPYNPWDAPAGVDFGGEIELSTPDGRRLRVRRFLRGARQHFECENLDAGGSLLEADLHAIVPVSREMYARLFALDLGELTELDERIAAQIVERFAADFETLGEIASPAEALEYLATRIGELHRRGRRGKRTPLITELERKLKAAREEYRRAREEAARLPELYQRRDDLQAESKAARHELVRCQSRIERLQAMGPVREALNALRNIDKQLAALRDMPDVTREQFGNLQARRTRIDALREDLSRLREEEKDALAVKEQAETGARKFAPVFELGEDAIEAGCYRIEELVRLRRESESVEEDLARLREEVRRATAPLRADGNAEAVTVALETNPDALSTFESLLDQAADLEKELATVRGRYEALQAAVAETEDEVQRLSALVPEDFPEDFSPSRLSAAERAADMVQELREMMQALDAQREARAGTEKEARRVEEDLADFRKGIVVLAAGLLLGAGGALLTTFGTEPVYAWLVMAAGCILLLGGAFWSALSYVRRSQARDAARALLERMNYEVRRLENDVERRRKRLTELLAQAGIETDGETLEIREEDIRNLRRWNEAAASAQRLNEAREKLARARESLKKEYAAVEELEQKIDAVWNEIAAACEKMGIDPPGDRNAMAERRRLEAFRRFRECWTDLRTREKRAADTRKQMQACLDEISPVLSRLNIPDAEHPDAGTAARLRRLVREAGAAQQRLDAAEQELRRVQRRIEQQEQALEKEQKAMADDLKAIGLEDPDLVQTAFDKSEERRELERRREQWQQLIEQHRGRLRDILEGDNEGTPKEDADGDSEPSGEDVGELSEERILARLQELEVQRQECERRIEQIEQELGSVQREIGEIEKKADVEVCRSHMAAIEAQLEEARHKRNVFVLTEYLLREAVHTFEKEHRLPVLERAGDYLARFTAGRYAALRIDREQKGAEVLRSIGVIAASGGIPRQIDALSRGTAEQVYLSLRLALAVEMAEGRPLPFVLDDVLVNADPERLRGCVERLAEFAKETQVLAFTCHPHIAAEFEAVGARTIPLTS